MWVGVLVVLTSLWVLMDAMNIGVKKGQIAGMWNLGSVMWFLGCLLMWIIVFPMYLIKRPEYIRANTTQ